MRNFSKAVVEITVFIWNLKSRAFKEKRMHSNTLGNIIKIIGNFLTLTPEKENRNELILKTGIPFFSHSSTPRKSC